MTRGPQFYDPEVQTTAPAEPELPPIQNFLGVEAPGTYLLTDDVSAWLARFAERFHGEGRLALLDAARAFAPAAPEPDVEEPPAEQEQPPAASPAPVPGPPPLDMSTDFPGTSGRGDTITVAPATIPAAPVADPQAFVPARVEVYPDETGRYWYARPVDASGRILGEPLSQVNHDGVIGDANRTWPGAPIHEVPDALTDSIWQESNPATTWNGRQRPSPNRLFGK